MSLPIGLALLAFATLPIPLAGPHPGAIPPGFAQVVVRQRIMVRVPRLSPASNMLPARTPMPPPVVWEEKSGPRCVPVAELAGARLTDRRAIDLVLTGGKRVRARLHRSCTIADFDRGFYLKPHSDGMVCSDRDTIRSRAGAACEIDSFRRLVPKR